MAVRHTEEPSAARRVVGFWSLNRGKTVQEVDCVECGVTDVEVCEDDRKFGTTYEVVCPNILCGATITWTDEGDG